MPRPVREIRAPASWGPAFPKPIRLIVDTGSEIHCVGIETGPCSRAQRPESADDNRLAICALQGSPERTGIRVECVDPAVPEIADQQVFPEAAESGRCDHDAPWVIEMGSAGSNQSLMNLPFASKTLTAPAPWRHSHKPHTLVVNGLNVIGRIAGWKMRISERPREGCGLEVFVKHIDFATLNIRCI